MQIEEHMVKIRLVRKNKTLVSIFGQIKGKLSLNIRDSW
jgi:hypothetical protein